MRASRGQLFELGVVLCRGELGSASLEQIHRRLHLRPPLEKSYQLAVRARRDGWVRLQICDLGQHAVSAGSLRLAPDALASVVEEGALGRQAAVVFE